MKHRRLVQHWASGFSLFILVIMFFWRTALTNLILVGLDVFTYFYPYKAYAVQAITEGSVPLWNPYLFMGVPFLANIQAATLYPLNLPLCWLSIPKMTTCSILIHVFLAGAFTYLFCRQVLRLGAWGAFVSAVTFALGGFLGAQVEHVNQLSVLTWLPALLWLFHHSFTRRGLLLPSLTGLVIGLQFLGGHVQASYINLVALGSYALYLTAGQARRGMMSGQHAGHVARILMRGMGLFLTVVLLGGGLAAIQLLPTYELSTLSIRSGGLPYRQAVSFSLRPELVVRSLLPSFYDNPFSEYVAYVGILPLLLVGLAIWRRGRRQQAPFFITLSMLGLFLALGAYNPAYFALYRLVPGFGVFRAPARWLCLYAFGVAVLAGLGVEELASLTKMNADGPFLLRSRKRIALASLGLLLLAALTVLSDLPSTMVTVTWAGVAAGGLALLWVGVRRQRRVPYLALVVCLVVLELLVASRYLPYNRGTAPEAFSSMRTAVSRLLTDEGVHRFLSFSDGSFDPGDLHEIQGMFADQLSEEAVYDYLVATKQKELVTPNLSLLYGLQSVDGYDGGVLPLAGYVELQRLLLSEDDLSPDGRLQGRITEIPRAQVLNLFNVKYVLTDKVYDTWVDGVFYDLGQRAILGGENATELLLDDLPRFPTTALGVVSYLMNGGELAQGSPMAEIRIDSGDGRGYSFVLRAGEDTAEGEYEIAETQHRPARVVGHWRGNPAGNDYHTLLRWDDAIYPQTIQVRYSADEGQLRLRGMTLIDQRTGTHHTLVVSSEGRYRLVHSGDVKIYQNLDVLPRAFVVHQARIIQDDESTIAAMQEESFEPDKEVILSAEGPSLTPSGGGEPDWVSIVSYEPERVIIETVLESPGYLVLTDAYYPGWQALVDGRAKEILRADYYFRAVYLTEGKHLVEFLYTPVSFKAGLTVSLVSLLILVGAVAWDLLRRKPSTTEEGQQGRLPK